MVRDAFFKCSSPRTDFSNYRGEDGVGVAVVKCDMPPGEQFLKRVRSNRKDALSYIFKTITRNIPKIDHDAMRDDISLKRSIEYVGDIYLGHLRYGTHADHGVEYCQPYLYKNTVAAKSCVLIGNFNMANAREQFNQLVKKGINPTSEFDAHIVLNTIAHCLDQEYNNVILEKQPSDKSDYNNNKFFYAARKINLANVIKRAAQDWDGGYVFAGALGNGDSFVCRDPAGIRPCFYYADDEVIAVASERAALMGAFNISCEKIKPIKPGHIFIIKADGSMKEEQFTALLPERQCMFERIYFSRINDPDIYQERKALGKNLALRVLEKIDDNFDDTIFAYVPNSGEAALIGLVEEIDKIRTKKQVNDLWHKIVDGSCDYHDLVKLSTNHSRVERLIYKDQVLRTFITNGKERSSLIAHIYDVTRGIVQPCNTLVVVDDSIVRGTTLRTSIMKQLSSLNPKHIIFVSSCPPIMYPDCYGIDMSQLGNFIAFRVAVDLLKKEGKHELLKTIAEKCQEQEQSSMVGPLHNYLQHLYDHFSLEKIENYFSQLIATDLAFDGKITIVYQSLEGLRKALPNHHGDWYFTGNYPTPGGFKVCNSSYLKWYYGDNSRAY